MTKSSATYLEKYKNMTDLEWRDLIIQNSRSLNPDPSLPRFPPEHIQKQFVGGSYDHTMREAFNFYAYFKNRAEELGQPFAPDSAFLDFGCGWGRFLRLFVRDFNADNLHGVDVNEHILRICDSTGVPGNLSQIEPLGHIPLAPRSIDYAMAYSVFTHLPEPVHLHWLHDLARVLKPKGLFCFTLQPRRFLDFIERQASEGVSDWHKALGKFAPQISGFRSHYDSGGFVFLKTLGARPEAETYGDAIVPLSYIEKWWSPYFEIVEHIDKPDRFQKAVVLVRRR
ncbi:MAG: class I SAM-dependent methyltransferase [Hyphomicrobiales bacterium]|nr:class I SAM-dependent methyltransferase [Hyphomicrobiales bacterium]